ncbi:hypothetical protein NECAME_15173 [Necator americanus]|uniref:7TM chemoreceptor n=1 Tax=Necator americanus TaxID=51031 RepID=W2SLB4_NECAM|nr:hypothetical protein NECAME_15173 [Necator americanus]ETN69661.1 hypothetical protein NECAME_15173 [Necator americanus]
MLTGYDSSECAQFGVSLSHILLNPLHLGLLAEHLLLISTMAGITIYSAIRIRCTLVKATLSENLRKMHWKMYTLLLLQTASPLLFLHTPCFAGFLFLFTGLKSTTISLNIVTILFSLFPFFNPIFIIGFLCEYRNYTLAKMRLYKRSSEVQSRSAFVSKVRATAMSQRNVSSNTYPH